MVGLAAVSVRDRLHVLRPAPARLERAVQRRMAAYVHDRDLSLVEERPGLVGGRDALHLERCHLDLLFRLGVPSIREGFARSQAGTRSDVSSLPKRARAT